MAFMTKITKLLKYQIIHNFSKPRSSSSVSVPEEAFSPNTFGNCETKRISILDIKPRVRTEKIFSIMKMNARAEKQQVEEVEGVDSSLSEIRKELMRFDAGEIQFSIDDKRGIAFIKLCNEERKNALSGKMIIQLSDVIDDLERWTNGKAVLVYASGDCFTSGMDLGMIREKSDQFGGHQMATLMNAVLGRLQALPLITAAVVQGRAMGGGAEFITSFDFRLFAPSAEVRFVHARMGVSTGIAGGGSRLVNLIGPSKALQVLLSGEVIPAKRALDMGLATAIFESDSNSLESAMDWIAPLIEDRDTNIVRTIKQIVHNATVLPLDQALEREKQLFVEAWGSPTLLKALHEGKKHK